MKYFTIALLAGYLAMLPAAAFSEDIGMARIGLVRGDVQMSSAEAREWLPAATNTPLQQGDRIWVPEEGRSEVLVAGGVTVRLDAMTSFDMLTLGDRSVQFFLNGGRAYINNRNPGLDVVQVDTPLSSVTCRDGSVVTIDVYEDGATDISVIHGYASVETRDGKTGVSPGNTLRIGPYLSADTFPIANPDEWVTWNRDRDRRFVEIPNATGYLPPELGDYASDLHRNGRWIETPEYGYVWTPRVSLSTAWAPYRVGKWAWIRGNYVWISYESWGWAPYHYGRWAFIPRTGWCWVPPRRGHVRWAPGYVAWVHTPSHVSWVPLAPGETYYARGNYGPGSVNITNVPISTLNVMRQFRNIHVNNAVTVLPRDNFISGRTVGFKVRENPFTGKNIGFGPPPIKPSIATMAPVIKPIPAVKLPPPQVRRINVEHLRQERKLVTSERGSAFRPGGPVREIGVVPHKEPLRATSVPKPGYRPDPRYQPGSGVISPRKPVVTPVQPQPVGRPAIRKPEQTWQGPAPGAPPPVPRERNYKQPVPLTTPAPATTHQVTPAPDRRIPKVEVPPVHQPQVQQPAKPFRPYQPQVQQAPHVPAPAWQAPKIQAPPVQQPPVRQFSPAQPAPEGRQEMSPRKKSPTFGQQPAGSSAPSGVR